MSVRFDTPVALIMIWAGLLIMFMVMRPSPLNSWMRHSIATHKVVGSAGPILCPRI
jgi:hypothetical protein